MASIVDDPLEFGTSPEAAARSLLNATLIALRDATNAAIAPVTLSHKRPERGLAAIEAMQPVVESMIKILSDSNPGYAERDLPHDAREALWTIRHNIRILQALYGDVAK